MNESTKLLIKIALQATGIEPLTEKQLQAVAALADSYADHCCQNLRRLLAEEAERRAA